MRTPTPMFEHDCDECAYLGTIHAAARPEGFVDLYRCDAHGATVIARYGDDGPEYSSAPLDMAERFGGEIAVAGKLAVALGKVSA